MTLKQALLGATVLAVLPMAAQAQTTTTRRSTTTTPTTQYVAPTAAPAATYAPAPVVAPVPAYNPNIISGLYISGGIGGDMALNSNASGIQTQYKAGYVGVAAIGYGFGNGFRAEVEANFRQNAIDKVKFASVTQGGSGYLNNWAGMVNGLYDFDLGFPIFPYIGAGVGIAIDKFDGGKSYRANTIFPGIGPTNLISQDTITGSDTVVAFQAIGGFSYPVEAVPGLSLTVDYKFFVMPWKRTLADHTNLDCGSSTGAGCFGYTHLYAAGNGSYAGDFNHSLTFGLRYAFGGGSVSAPAAAAPAAPAAPAIPAVQPARSYLVFFDWDKADLTARARQIIADAAQASTKIPTTRIEVAGHADTTGTAGYNQGLSMKRAEAVAAELVKAGVARSAISISAFGSTKPLVATGPQVREPQNRRVEIVLK